MPQDENQNIISCRESLKDCLLADSGGPMLGGLAASPDKIGRHQEKA